MAEVVVVGGGAAGLIAAWSAAQAGAAVRLLEKNARLGLKIHISGGGKCNITHAGEMEAVRSAFTPAEARFLIPSFRRFSNEDVLAIFHQRGVSTHVRPDGRVFPDSGNAQHVVEALRQAVLDAGAIIDCRSPVTGLVAESGRIRGVQVGDQFRAAERVIVAVGGSSYPKTGTTGDGYRWMEQIGHTIVPLRAALAPIQLGTGRRPEYSGVALRGCVLKVRRPGKELARWSGDLLYTHHGVSGPCALGVSRAAALAMESGPVTLEVDLIPNSSSDVLMEMLRQEQDRGSHRQVSNLVSQWMPERLLPELFHRVGLDPQTPLHRMPKSGRNRLVDSLKRWELGEAKGVPLEQGEVTAGGVDLTEVDPRTMESRRIAGLFPCGELLDLAGPVGGYNLQAAFSTGFVAGRHAAGAD